MSKLGICSILIFATIVFLILGYVVYHVKIVRDISGNDLEFNIPLLLSKNSNPRPPRAESSFKSIIFIHHSVGENLCNEGPHEIPPARVLFQQKGFQFFSHNYNKSNNSKPLEYHDGSNYKGYNIPWDSTNPDGLAYLFSQKVRIKDPDGVFGNAFSRMLAYHDVIIVKSCYIASDIETDKQLDEYKQYYLKMKEIGRKHPGKIFIIFTTPPRNNRTKPEFSAYNARAAALSRWISDDSYAGDVPNLFIFDFGGYLGESDPTSPDYNGLKREYQISETDSHPNEKANCYLRPKFVEFVITVIQKYRNAHR